MNKIIYPILISLFMVSCGEAIKNEKSKNNNKEEKKDISESTKEIADGDYFFRGVIDHKYPFHMKFELREGKITGSYYYDSQKKEISLDGEIISGNLELDEKYKDKITGHFTSEIFTADSISGNWKSPKGKKMSFALFNSSNENYQNSLKAEEQTWTKDEFLAWIEKFETAQFPFSYEPESGDAQQKEFNESEVKMFAFPEYDSEYDFGNRFYYGKKVVTENYIGLVFTHEYVPGAFGIFNYNVLLKTYTPEGQLITSEYLGCNCYDNNMYDYYSTTEKFKFTKDMIYVDGESTTASHEWAAEDSMPVFENTEPIKRQIKLKADGRIGN